MQALCLCCSGKMYSHCCEILHQGGFPENALALMRSRYTAYALQKPEYIIHTTHPDHPDCRSDTALWTQKILYFSQNTEFQKLDIIEVSENLNQAYVTFRACLLQNKRKGQLLEKSHFVKIGQQWLYREAIDIHWS